MHASTPSQSQQHRLLPLPAAVSPPSSSPEYAYTLRVKEKSNTYSFEVVILELVTAWNKPICIGRHAFGDLYRATNTVIKGPGKLKMVFEGKEEKAKFEVFNFTGTGGVALSMYNTDESIYAFAEASMNTAYQEKWPLYRSTKNTILKKYDGRFKDIFQDVYEAKWKSKFEAAGIW